MRPLVIGGRHFCQKDHDCCTYMHECFLDFGGGWESDEEQKKLQRRKGGKGRFRDISIIKSP